MLNVKVLSVVPIVALTACGGAGTNPNVVNLNQKFSAIETAAGMPIEQFENLPESAVTLANVGVGTAQFTGVVVAPVDYVGEEVAIGDMTLNANFNTGSLGGNATKFGIFNGATATNVNQVRLVEELSGSLSVSNGTLYDGADTVEFSGDLNGVLVGSDRFTVETQMVGAVTRVDTTGKLFATGFAEGTVTSSQGVFNLDWFQDTEAVIITHN